MATTAFSTFLPNILVQVPSVPSPMVTTYVRYAVTELCKDGGVWLEDLTPIDSVVDQDEYTLVSNDATNGLIRTVNDLYYNNVRATQQNIKMLRAEHPDHPNVLAHGTPYKWSMLDRDTVTLFPVPIEIVVAGIAVRTTTIPKMTATGVDSDVAEDYEETIIHGTLSRLLRMPDKSWTDIKMADYHGRKFRSDISYARARIEKGFTDSSQQADFPKITPLSISIRRAI